jgi:hypothetical protein
MTFAFNIAHTTDGRTRIRWAGDSTEIDHIRKIADGIAGIKGIERAIPRMRTGSIIIDHGGVKWSSLMPQLTEKLSLEFKSPAARRRLTGLETFNQGLHQVDETLKDMNTDLHSLTVIMLVVLSITQALRGQVMVSSGSLLWYAFSVASKARRAADSPPDITPDTTE